MVKAYRTWARSTSSPAVTDPYLRMAAGLVKQACIDLSDPDPKTALDALCWWLDDPIFWFDALQMPVHPDPFLVICRLGVIEHAGNFNEISGNIEAGNGKARRPGVETLQSGVEAVFA